MLNLRLLGSFRLESETGLLRLPTHKVEALLAYLVLYPQPHSREKLAALLWGDFTDAQARNSLRTALRTLRRQLGDELLLADRETVQLNPNFPLWVDVREFESAAPRGEGEEGASSLVTELGSGQSKEPAPSVARGHLSLYKGDLLADYYDDWILRERERYRDLYLDTLLRLAQSARAAGDYLPAIEYAHDVLATDPTNESAYQQLMFCYLASGNRHAALKHYEECKRVLRQELDTDPAPETTALYHEIKQSASEQQASAARLTNVPLPLTSFVGRQREIGEIKGILARQRLVTLTGAGGSGKTRLAIQVATDLLNDFKDGVWWIELVSLTDPALLPHAVSKVLGVREVPNQPLIETLANHLRAMQLLFVLDNCEHLIDACARLVEALLSDCPDL
jgi:DNA-binding SARP family transcriptional activator